jgi:hypothetical protein
MSWLSVLRRGAVLSRLALTLSVEVGMAAMLFVTHRDKSKKAFRKGLSDQDLPAEVVEELSRAYDAGQIHFRELVRSRGPWGFEP